MYALSYYIPAEDHERVKQALFDCGAGKIGQYSECCWQVQGMGQFRPGQGSEPSIGSINQLESVVEYKVEMVCDDQLIRELIETLIIEHPYEQPAYFFQRVMTLKDL